MTTLSPTDQLPSLRDLGAAIESGAIVRARLPTCVRIGPRSTAHLNLAGGIDPWITVRAHGEDDHLLYDAASSTDRYVSVGGMAVDADVPIALDEALRLCPSDPHDPEADAARLTAGHQALRIVDVMVRGRMLDLVDGWSALIDDGEVIEKTTEGLLLHVSSLDCRLLVLVCPSTGRRYTHPVPDTLTTVRAAREWMYDGPIPEAES